MYRRNVRQQQNYQPFNPQRLQQQNFQGNVYNQRVTNNTQRVQQRQPVLNTNTQLSTTSQNQKQLLSELRIQTIQNLLSDVKDNNGKNKLKILNEFKQKFSQIIGNNLYSMYENEEDNLMSAVTALIKNPASLKDSEGWTLSYIWGGVKDVFQFAVTNVKNVKIIGQELKSLYELTTS